MKSAHSVSLLLLVGPALALAGLDRSGATEYTEGQSTKIKTSVSLSVETTNFEMLRDGEPVEGGRLGRGGAFEEHELVVERIDRVTAVETGRPTGLIRSYESVELSSALAVGEAERGGDVDSPFDGIELELTLGEDGVLDVQLTDGDAPDDELLEGERLTFVTDGLLASAYIEDGASWEFDASAVESVLLLAERERLFPEANEVFASPGGERRGPGGFGPGGPRGWPLPGAEWRGRANVVALDHDHGGRECVEIELEFVADGDLPERETRGGRDFALAHRSVVESPGTYDSQFEGRLVVTADHQVPVLLEIEGRLETITSRSIDRQSGMIEINSTRAGSWAQTIEFEALEPTTDDDQ